MFVNFSLLSKYSQISFCHKSSRNDSYKLTHRGINKGQPSSLSIIEISVIDAAYSNSALPIMETFLRQKTFISYVLGAFDNGPLNFSWRHLTLLRLQSCIQVNRMDEYGISV